MHMRTATTVLLSCWLLAPVARAADTGPSIGAPGVGAPAASTPGPRVPSARERVAMARDAIGRQDWTKAIYELNLALREDQRNADIHNLLGYSYRKQASPDLPNAFKHYKAAIRLDARHKGAHEYIGEAYLMDGKPQEAEKHLAALKEICGNTSCGEYADLAKAIADYKARN